VVYCSTRRRADWLVERLQELAAGSLHGDLDQRDRDAIVSHMPPMMPYTICHLLMTSTIPYAIYTIYDLDQRDRDAIVTCHL